MIGTMFLLIPVMMGTAALLEVVRYLAKRGRRSHDALSGRAAGPPAWVGPAQVVVVIGGFALAGYLMYDGHRRTMAAISPELKGMCPPPQPRYNACRNR